jgi:hypothetical protein
VVETIAAGTFTQEVLEGAEKRCKNVFANLVIG